MQLREIIVKVKPIPLKLNFGRGRPPKYPWKYLQVGKGFEIPYRMRRKLAPLAVYHGKKLGMKFAIVQLQWDKSKAMVCRIQ